jgi:hypothetical protein
VRSLLLCLLVFPCRRGAVVQCVSSRAAHERPRCLALLRSLRYPTHLAHLVHSDGRILRFSAFVESHDTRAQDLLLRSQTRSREQWICQDSAWLHDGMPLGLSSMATCQELVRGAMTVLPASIGEIFPRFLMKSARFAACFQMVFLLGAGGLEPHVSFGGQGVGCARCIRQYIHRLICGRVWRSGGR